MGTMQVDRRREHEEDLSRLARLRVIDDDFMRCVFRDQRELTEDVLRVICGLEGLHVVQQETQRDLKRLAGARSVELDVWAVGDDGTEYDMEVQRGDDPYPRRLRYHSACMDVETLDAGQDFSDLPEQWVVFIMEEDPFGQDEGTYLFRRTCDNILLEDGTHYLYVNGAYRGNDELGALMSDFCQSDPNAIGNKMLADRVRYWKENPEGVRKMCEILEEMRDEAMRKGMEKGMEKGSEQTLLNNVRSLMEGVGWTAQQALDTLRVPESDRAKYLAML